MSMRLYSNSIQTKIIYNKRTYISHSFINEIPFTWKRIINEDNFSNYIAVFINNYLCCI